MIIECPECSARFRVADEKIKSGGIKVRCSKCKAVFSISPESERRFSRSDEERQPGPGSDPFSMDDPFEQTSAPFGKASLGREVSVDEADPPAESFTDNPFEREDPFAVTAFGQTAADPDSFDLDQHDAPTSSPRRKEPAPRGLDPFEREDPFAVTSFEFGKKAPSSDGGSGFDFSIDDDPSITAGPIPGLETNASPYGGADYGNVRLSGPSFPKVVGRSEMLGEESLDGDISTLGNPERAQMMLDATAPDDQDSYGAGYGEIDFGGQDPLADLPAKERRPKMPNWGKGNGRPALPKEAPRREPSPSRPEPMEGSAPTKLTTPVVAPVVKAAVIPPARSVAESSDGGVRILQGFANFVLILMIIAASFLGFVAMMNDWLLDFRAMDDITAQAFGKGAYTPRHLADAESNKAALAPPAPPSVDVEELKNLYFPNSEGVDLFIVEGQIVNRTEGPVRKIKLTGEVFDEAGARVGQQEAPAGRPLSEEELLDVVDAEALKKANARIEAESEALEVKPGQGMRFSLVFLDLPGTTSDKRTFKVKVSAFEAAAGAPAPDPEEEVKEAPRPPPEKGAGKGRRQKTDGR